MCFSYGFRSLGLVSAACAAALLVSAPLFAAPELPTPAKKPRGAVVKVVKKVAGVAAKTAVKIAVSAALKSPALKNNQAAGAVSAFTKSASTTASVLSAAKTVSGSFKIFKAAPAKSLAAKPTLTKPLAAKPAPIVINSGLLLGGAESAMVEVIAGGKGRINYEANLVKAVGLGALPPPTLSQSRAQNVLSARNAALADALRTLGMAVSRVRVSSDSRVQNFVLQSDEIRLRVRALVASAQVVDEKYLPTSGVFRIVVQMNLTGPNSVSEAVGVGGDMGDMGGGDMEVNKGEINKGESAAPTPEFVPGAPAPASARYSCVLVDCRGLQMASCMSPRIYQTTGDEVWGTMQIPPEFVIETGIAAFPRSMEGAMRCSRAGSNPLIVKAYAMRDSNRFYPIISNKDADTLREANRDSHFFERTAVIFLLDPLR